MSKYSLCIIEPYFSVFHGPWERRNLPSKYNGTFICQHIIELFDFYHEQEDLQELIYHMENWIRFAQQNYSINHPIIENFWKLHNKKYFCQLNIAKTYETETGELMCILKTFWIRIFQRKFRNYIAKKKKIILMRKNPTQLFFRKINGRWKKNIRYI
tara:strand:- start:388 stop:858 length:471 start_codon:yes stop_codon:yes gene_type:complete